MGQTKKDCFAYISEDKYRGCFCLNELYCRKEHCSFYQEKTEAKRKYLNTYNIITANKIAKATDNHFRSL